MAKANFQIVLLIVIPGDAMSTTKVAISVDTTLLREVDSLVGNNVFPNRSKAFQEAVREKLERMKHLRLAIESKKMDREEEQELAEEGMDDAWPEY